MNTTITDTKGKPAEIPQPNAWLVRPGAITNPFTVARVVAPNLASGMAEGDLT